MKQLLIVAGTRPEIIKLAPLILEARKNETDIHVSFCLTGQHRTMAEEALSIFGISPDFDLQIMKAEQSLNDIAGTVFERLPAIIQRVHPDVLVVQGDTTTAAMSALCAFNMKVPVGHVEAGLRSFDLSAPFPEELNRKLISSSATYNFCPTVRALENLKNEGNKESILFLTGNTIVDAIEIIARDNDLEDASGTVPSLKKPYVLVTAHRRESFGDGFMRMCSALHICALQFPSYQFVYPVHLNPTVDRPVREALSSVPNVVLVPPVSYVKLLTLLRHCEFVLTDSGGIQEEAPSFGKYCIVMRDVTERMESVEMGISELVGTDEKKIVRAVQTQINAPTAVSEKENPYGDGHAAGRILDILVK